MAVPDFDRLYLDTTVLRKTNWPRISVELATLLELARNFGIDVVIPEPVESEREEQWVRDFGEASQKYLTASKKRSLFLGAIGVDVAEGLADRLDELRSRYREVAQAVIKQNGIKTASITTRAVGHFLKLAITRTPPFQISGDKVTGFQDTAILLSILDDMQNCGKETCAVLSDDGVFSKVDAVCSTEGKTIRHLRSVEEFWKTLGSEIEPPYIT